MLTQNEYGFSMLPQDPEQRKPFLPVLGTDQFTRKGSEWRRVSLSDDGPFLGTGFLEYNDYRRVINPGLFHTLVPAGEKLDMLHLEATNDGKEWLPYEPSPRQLAGRCLIPVYGEILAFRQPLLMGRAFQGSRESDLVLPEKVFLAALYGHVKRDQGRWLRLQTDHPMDPDQFRGGMGYATVRVAETCLTDMQGGRLNLLLTLAEPQHVTFPHAVLWYYQDVRIGNKKYWNGGHVNSKEVKVCETECLPWWACEALTGLPVPPAFQSIHETYPKKPVA